MKILHADDHPMFREGVHFFLKLLDKEVTIVEVSSIQAALDQLALHEDIKLILLDIDMPGMAQLAGFHQIRQAYPKIPLVFLSAVEEPETIKMLIDQGAKGYILKSTSSEVLLSALRQVLEGGIYLPDAYYIDVSHKNQTHAKYGLTTRQQEILKLMVEGLPNKLIADRLKITEGTVKNHIKAIFQILKVYNRTQAVLKAKEIGYG